MERGYQNNSTRDIYMKTQDKENTATFQLERTRSDRKGMLCRLMEYSKKLDVQA